MLGGFLVIHGMARPQDSGSMKEKIHRNKKSVHFRKGNFKNFDNHILYAWV
jgi:hypothetical protein